MIFVTVFIDLLGFAIVLPLLPVYAQWFSTDHSGWQLGLLMASFSLMQFLFAPVWGRLSDRIGRRPVLMIGLAGSVVFYFLFGIATVQRSMALLFLSRIGAGIAGATISTAQAYIADSTSLEQRPKGMALIGMAFGLGFTLGPLLGYLAVWGNPQQPGPAPGYVASALSAGALVLAFFLLPESLDRSRRQTVRHFFDAAALRQAIETASIRPLLISIFVCVFSFANFETTLSLLIKGGDDMTTPFHFDFRQVFLTYAFIGFMLALVQGMIVRRLAGRVPEGMLAGIGAGAQVVGFVLVLLAVRGASTGLLFAALAVVVAGFGMMSPSLNSLLSRRSDPARQGGILGVGQSVNSMARILGSGIGLPMLKASWSLPYVTAAGLMLLGLLLVLWASRRGTDYAA
ncbi:MAG: MFS transporter [Pirellulaceae bacterium]|nr:MFS transporter [Planctomycetales bacterium]